MKFSSKTTKDMGDMICGKLRKPAPSVEEITHLMAVREVYHATNKGLKACVVIPEGRSVETVLDNFYKSLKANLMSGLIKVTTLDNLTVEDLDYACVVDFNGLV